MTIIAEARAAKGIAPRIGHSRRRSRIRLLGAILNEAALVLEEGVAQRPGDIDVTLVHGYGFPRWRGGPIWWASGETPERIAAMMDAVATGRRPGFHWPARWTPCSPRSGPSAKRSNKGNPAMRDVFICDYIRTPIGRYGGALSSVRADDLGGCTACVRLMARNGGRRLGRGGRRDLRLRQPGGRGQPQRRAHVGSAGRPARDGARHHDEPAVRLGHGRGHARRRARSAPARPS